MLLPVREGQTRGWPAVSRLKMVDGGLVDFVTRDKPERVGITSLGGKHYFTIDEPRRAGPH